MYIVIYSCFFIIYKIKLTNFLFCFLMKFIIDFYRKQIKVNKLEFPLFLLIFKFNIWNY